jgi:ligand-binding sensor domain-containing protein/DNA-binding CsgD family transcriptional regulator
MKSKIIKVGLGFGLKLPNIGFIFKGKPMRGGRISTCFCLVLLFAAAILPLSGYSTELGFQNISTEDGLAQNTVTCILSDRRGFMWFGSEGGLNRYDGYNFKIYSHFLRSGNCLSNDQVNNMVMDGDGSFWIGTIGGGLNHFDPSREKFTCFRSIPGDPGSLSNDSVRVILPVGDGLFWIGTDNGLNKFASRSRVFTRYLQAQELSELDGRNTILSLLRDKSGIIWVGSGNGLYRFDSVRETFSRFQSPGDDRNASKHNQINALFEDGKGTLWLGTEAGLVRFDKQNGTFNFKVESADPFPHLYRSRIFQISRDNQNRVWVATESGVYIFPSMNMITVYFQAGAVPKRLLANRFIISIFQDAEDVVWAGTVSGIYKYDLKTQQFSSYGREIVAKERGSSTFPVTAVCQDRGGSLWLGTYKNGLIKFSRGLDEKVSVVSLPGSPRETKDTIIPALHVGRDQILWLGTNMGLHAYEIEKNLFRDSYSHSQAAGSLSDNRVTAFLEDRYGGLWVGTQNGLNRFDRSRGIFTVFRNGSLLPKTIGSDYITAIYQDSLGVMWIGTYGGGLSRFDPDRGVFQKNYRHRENDSSSLSCDKVNCMLEDRRGQFWVGTKSGGLNRFDRESGKFICFTSEDGLANNDILGLLEDQLGNLWMSTNRGLCQFDPPKKTFRNFTVRDGLPGDEFLPMSFYKARDQEMFFGGSNGLTSFFPEKVKANPHVPPVAITSVTIHNRNQTISDDAGRIKKIELGYKDTVVSFTFAALSYSDPKRNRYAYKINGLNDEWIQIGNRHEITVSNLRPGNYVFRVKGTNNDGVWNEQGENLTIHVSPPWWQTWWFRVPAFLFLLWAMTQWYRTRMRRLAAQIRTEAAMEQYLNKYDISQREKEIVLLLLKGKSNKEIEDVLFIAMGTVKNHIYSIYQKIGVKNRAQLMALFKNLQVK